MNGLIASAKGQAEFYTDPRAMLRAIAIPVSLYLAAEALMHLRKKRS